MRSRSNWWLVCRGSSIPGLSWLQRSLEHDGDASSDRIRAGRLGVTARLLQGITADGEWLARATRRQPSRLAFLRVSAGCTTLAQCGPRPPHQSSNWDLGQAWFLSSSATLADTPGRHESGSLAGDDRAANCRMMGGFGTWNDGAQSRMSSCLVIGKHGAARGSCLDSWSLG